MHIDDRDVILAEVKNGLGSMGICTVTKRIVRHSDRTLPSDYFYVGGEPIIIMTPQRRGDCYSNKLISQISSIEKCGDDFRDKLASAADNYFMFNQPLVKSMQPVLEMLCDGLYVIRISKMLPSDGVGNFFWNAYTIHHEINGSSEYNQTIGKENNYNSCFLVPTESISNYSESKSRILTDKMKKGAKTGGIAFQLSGMFCALVDGHHAATACLLADTDFNCIVIEQVRDVLYESEEAAAALKRSPQIVALSCPYVKLPLEQIPDTMLETFLLSRRGVLPNQYEAIKNKSNNVLKLLNKRIIPKDAYAKAELLPDVEMIQSAHAVTSLSDDELTALLHGETMLNDKVIISQNYYSSVVTACNYLQYADFNRFIAFTLAILYNPDLFAVHKYIAERLQNIMHPKIEQFFSKLITSDKNENPDMLAYAEKYERAYKEFADRKVQEDFDESFTNEKFHRKLEEQEKDLENASNPSMSALDLSRVMSSMKGGAKK